MQSIKKSDFPCSLRKLPEHLLHQNEELNHKRRMLGIQNTSKSTQKGRGKIHRMIVKGEPRATESNDLVWRRGVQRSRRRYPGECIQEKKIPIFLHPCQHWIMKKHTHVYLPFILNLLFYFTFDTRGVGF